MELAIQVQIEELPEGLFLATSHELAGLPEGTLRAILKQAGVDPDDFLAT